MQLRIKRLPHGADLPLPEYAHPGDAGFDLRAAIPATVRINPGERRLISAGIAVAVPDGFEMEIRGRSGLANKHGIAIAQGVGTIDAGYRGDVSVILLNTGADDFYVEPGMRIAQAVIAPVVRAELIEVNELDETARGAGGFGSTGHG